MPIYEYKGVGNAHCALCKARFEVRQGINDEPLSRCPECGAEVKRLVSRPFLCLKESLSQEETFDRYTEEEADELGLEEGFAEDEVWEWEGLEIEIPEDISKEQLVEAFCQYVENDYYEWLKDNFESFFELGEPDWEWIKGKLS